MAALRDALAAMPDVSTSSLPSDDAMTRPPAVRMRGIAKRFGAVQANAGVDLDVAAGSVHGIVGENGAGKSTLVSILYGFTPPDAGTIEIGGRPVRIGNAREALALGIGMVHQHFVLVETFTALDNILLGAEPSASLPQARALMRPKLDALMHETGLHVRLDEPVERLPVGERQRLEILKALVRGARILILDEPTAVLTPQETAQLFDVLRRLRAQGTTLILITHKLGEIMKLADRVTVMRAGRVVMDAAVAGVTLDGLAEAMVGRRVALARPPESAAAPAAHTEAASPRLVAKGLHLADARGVARLADVSLALHAGEIVGIAGVSGNGQSELLEVLAGMRAPQAGTMEVAGRSFAAGRWLDAASARRLRIAHVPEDRHRVGMVLPLPAWANAFLGHETSPGIAGAFGHVRRSVARRRAHGWMVDWDVRPADEMLRASKFSGGNQQKLVLAREAQAPAEPPQVLLVGQPTRGVDIGAIEFIHARLRAMRAAGAAILLVSSELDEILALADRVLVMDRGRIVGALPIEACTEAALGRLMAGEGHAAAPTAAAA